MHSIDVPIGRVAGGGSAINASVIRRARPDDFQRWADLGVHGWPFDETVGIYIEIENMSTGRDGIHGRNGPLPVRQLKPEDVTQTLRGFPDAGVAAGFRRTQV